MIDITLYEIARRNMVAFSEWFIENDTMTKEEWFDIMKIVLKEFRKEMNIEERGA